jgi:hypothetical protein
MVRIIIVMLLFSISSGCSYYGTNTLLIPADKVGKIECSGAQILVGAILTAQDKTSHAFAGIPYFPAVFNSAPAELGNLRIFYLNVPNDDICTLSDLVLKSDISEIAIHPLIIRKTKLVEKNGVKNMNCTYRFSQQLDVTQEYYISFKDSLLNCKLPDVRMSIKKDSGYHQVLLQ